MWYRDAELVRLRLEQLECEAQQAARVAELRPFASGGSSSRVRSSAAAAVRLVGRGAIRVSDWIAPEPRPDPSSANGPDVAYHHS